MYFWLDFSLPYLRTYFMDTSIFKFPLFIFFKKIKHKNIDITGYWKIRANFQIEKNL